MTQEALTMRRSVLMSGGWWMRARALSVIETDITMRARELMKPERISARWKLKMERKND